MADAHEESGGKRRAGDDGGGEQEARLTTVRQSTFRHGGVWMSSEDRRRSEFVPNNPLRNGDGSVGWSRWTKRECSSKSRGRPMSGARVKCFAAVMLLLACSLPSSLQTPEKGGVGPLGRLAALAGTRLRLQGVKPASTAWDSGGRVFGLSRTPQVQRLRGGWLCHNLVMQKAQASVQKDTHKTQQHQQQASDHVTAPEPEAPVTVNNSAMASLEAEVANLQAQVQSREAVGEPGEVEHVQGGGSSGGEPEPGESITRFEDIGRRTTALRQLSQDLEKLESWIDTAVQGYNKISDVLETEEALNHVPTETEIYRGRLSELRARWQLLYESARRILNTSPNDSTTKLFQGRCRDMLETDAKLSLLELKVSQECEWTEEGRKKLENGMGGVVYQLDAVEFAVGNKMLNSTKDYPVVWVTFVLNCSQTKPGDKLLVVGDSEELGDWEPVNASRLATSPQMYPLWNCTVPLKRGKMITYKYCIGRPSDTPDVFSKVIWEGHMGNREVRVHRSLKRPMVVEDAFHLLEEHVGNVADNRAPKFVAMHSYGHQDPEYVCFD